MSSHPAMKLTHPQREALINLREAGDGAKLRRKDAFGKMYVLTTLGHISSLRLGVAAVTAVALEKKGLLLDEHRPWTQYSLTESGKQEARRILEREEKS